MNRWRDLIDFIFIAGMLAGTLIILACLIAGCRADNNYAKHKKARKSNLTARTSPSGRGTAAQPTVPPCEATVNPTSDGKKVSKGYLPSEARVKRTEIAISSAVPRPVSDRGALRQKGEAMAKSVRAPQRVIAAGANNFLFAISSAATDGPGDTPAPRLGVLSPILVSAGVAVRQAQSPDFGQNPHSTPAGQCSSNRGATCGAHIHSPGADGSKTKTGGYPNHRLHRPPPSLI